MLAFIALTHVLAATSTNPLIDNITEVKSSEEYYKMLSTPTIGAKNPRDFAEKVFTSNILKTASELFASVNDKITSIDDISVFHHSLITIVDLFVQNINVNNKYAINNSKYSEILGKINAACIPIEICTSNLRKFAYGSYFNSMKHFKKFKEEFKNVANHLKNLHESLEGFEAEFKQGTSEN
ncbi:hypothetical protein H312_02917 [Anncaliia algerae PRA339]|uniref:Uncharacterized protein n=1 Tax=Anncaliia algerae PRA339 TaxID=1288291 RepID=A0A059EXU9_9MICR|nr:hypothetical protein H312_02917 [Anncaliia algerae PRA339]